MIITGKRPAIPVPLDQRDEDILQLLITQEGIREQPGGEVAARLVVEDWIAEDETEELFEDGATATE